MPILPCQKDFIDGAILCELDPITESETVGQLQAVVKQMRTDLTDIEKAHQPLICKFFHNPSLIYRLDEYGPISTDEIRGYLLNSIEEAIIDAAKKWTYSLQELGWDRAEIMAITTKKQNHSPAYLTYLKIKDLHFEHDPLLYIEAPQIRRAIDILSTVVPPAEMQNITSSIQNIGRAHQFVFMVAELARRHNLGALDIPRYQEEIFIDDRDEPAPSLQPTSTGCCLIS